MRTICLLPMKHDDFLMIDWWTNFHIILPFIDSFLEGFSRLSFFYVSRLYEKSHVETGKQVILVKIVIAVKVYFFLKLLS